MTPKALSREIKFRAYEVNHKKMIDLHKLTPLATTIEGHDGLYIPFVDNLILMQFTGLKDRNGKPIYENDFVTSKSHLPEVMQVEFIEGAFCMTHPTINGYPIDINHFYPSIGTDLEVIGNIYENPSLLTKENK